MSKKNTKQKNLFTKSDQSFDIDNKVYLYKTKEIVNKKKLPNNLWTSLKVTYKSNKLLQKVNSVLNAIATSQRKVFCLSYRSVQNIILNDKNLPSNTKIHPREYKAVLFKLTESFIFRIPFENENKWVPMIMCLKHPLFLQYVKNNEEQELKECIAFCKQRINTNNKDNLSDNILLDENLNSDIINFDKEFDNLINFKEE
jgi:hypothetical protein